MSDCNFLDKDLNKVCKDTLIEDRITKKLPCNSKVCKEDKNNRRNIKTFLPNSDEKAGESQTLHSSTNSDSNKGILSQKKY